LVSMVREHGIVMGHATFSIDSGISAK